MDIFFLNFLESIKTKDNEILIESLENGLENVVSESPRKIIGYELVDSQTKKVLKKYAADKRRYASRQADKLDLAYGAVRYSVKPIYDK